MILLSRLLLANEGSAQAQTELTTELLSISSSQLEDMLALAQLNHVVVRGLERFLALMRPANDAARIHWAETALKAECARVDTAILFLEEICGAFDEHGYGVAVIKSLDHWPDLGSDLDLFTDATPEEVCHLMKRRFNAEIEPRSWGDRLARKWNFMVPGLPEAVEIHVGRLGQTGEQVSIAASVLKRAREIEIRDHSFRVTCASDRILISTLQRMYRHFYFRLCDILDSAALVEDGMVDFEDLCASAMEADIWKGVATYYAIVSDYVKTYRGRGLDLPHFVRDAAQFGGNQIYYARGFLRVPIMPESARLYTAQLAGVLGKGEFHNGARLSLLPWLATAAVVGQKLTGSDKGIW